MVGSSPYDVSVVLPFRDDEELIGSAVQRVAAHLRDLGLHFEILAVDDNSGDNSHAVLALLRGQVPELRVMHAPVRGRGAETGIARAQGRVLWILAPEAAIAPLASFRQAHETIARDEVDAIVVRGRFAVAHRVRVLAAVDGLRGTGDALLRRLSRRLAARGLRVDVQELAHVAGASVAAPRAFLRWRTPFAGRRAAAEKRA